MGLFSSFFKRGEEPEATVGDAVLGLMHWSKDDESWAGEYNNVKFQLGYYGTKFPDPTIIAHARQILNDPAWLPTVLAEAKTKEKNSMGAKMRQYYEPEIDELTIETVSFWEKQRIFIRLEGGREYRCWRIECEGSKCLLGFDN
jgi:hypothetical protein